MMLAPILTPHGALTLRPTADAPELTPELGARLDRAFARGSGHGLLWLGANEVGAAMPPVLSYWRDFGARYVTALCALPNIGGERTKPRVTRPVDDELMVIAAAVPPMTGAEYLTADVLGDLWAQTDAAFDAELVQSKLAVQDFLKSRHPAWNLVGRVHFNLAENRRDEERPFAFLATYTTKLSAEGKAQHLPLGKALQDYAGAKNRARLLSLLMPVQRASERCQWLMAMVDAGEVFHPLRWGPQEALQFLKDVPALEAAGVVVRMPANWRMNRPARFRRGVVHLEKTEPASARFVDHRERKIRVGEGRVGLDVQRRRTGDRKADRKAGMFLRLRRGARGRAGSEDRARRDRQRNTDPAVHGASFPGRFVPPISIIFLFPRRTRIAPIPPAAPHRGAPVSSPKGTPPGPGGEFPAVPAPSGTNAYQAMFH